jgi:hypothetical protein
VLPDTGVDVAAMVEALVTGLGVVVGIVCAAMLAFMVVLKVRRHLSGERRSGYEIWLDEVDAHGDEEQDRDQAFRY